MIAWIVLTLALAYVAFAMAAANIVYGANPQMALRLYPTHPVALSNQAETALKNRSLSTAAALLDRSLRAQALNSEAVTLMGFVREAKGEKAAGRRLIELSGEMSKRNVAAQLWMIEDRVGNDDIPGAVKHYDVILRTSIEQAEMLIPILTEALDEPRIRTALIPYLKVRPSWAPSFWAYASQYVKNTAALAAMMVQAGGLPRDAASQSTERQLLVRLVDAGAYAGAAEFYRTLPGSNAGVPGSPRLSEASVDARFPPLTWQLAEGSGLGAAIEAGQVASSINIRVFADAGQQGSALRKMLLVQGGRYRLTIDQSLTTASEGGRADWRLSCARERAVDRIWPVQNAPKMDGRIDTQVQIPSDCRAVFLELLLSGGQGENGIEFLIRSIDLVPVGPNPTPA